MMRKNTMKKKWEMPLKGNKSGSSRSMMMKMMRRK
jgi:hypothetical protein